MTLLTLPKYLDVISPLLLLLLYLLIEKESLRKDYIFWFLLSQTILNGLSTLFDKVLLRDNLFFYHLNCIVSFIILSTYYYSILKTARSKLFIRVIFVLFGVFFIINLLYWESLNSFNSNSFSVACFLLVAYSFLYYLENLLRPATIDIAKSKDFWFVTGFLTYYTSTFFIFLTYRKLTAADIKDIGIIWQTHNIIFFILCIFLLKGILCKPLPEKPNL